MTALVSMSARAGGASDDAYEGIDPHRAVDTHALLDVYGATNLSALSSRTTQLRAFDMPTDIPSVAFAGVTLAHAPDTFGFRIDAGFGNTANAFFAYDPGHSAHPVLARAFSFVDQAFVSVVAPLPHPIQIDVGKLDTPVGLEDNRGLTNWNLSRGLLFTLAEPTVHTGVRATVAATPSVALTLFWLNGWNSNVVGGDGMRSFGVELSATPTPHLDTSIVFVAGPERAPMRLDDPTLGFRYEFSASATYEIATQLAVAATADAARDAASGGVSWWGAGAYARARASPWLAAVIRVEHYADPDGFTTGAPQRLDEGTVTLEANRRVGPVSSVARLEYRRDQSDVHAFGGSTHDDTLSLGLAAAF